MSIYNIDKIDFDTSMKRLQGLHDRTIELVTSIETPMQLFDVLQDRDWIRKQQDRLSAPYTIMVIGMQSSGKSSFINSLLGERILPQSDEPTDGVVSVWLYERNPNFERAEKINVTGEVEIMTVPEGLEYIQQKHTDRKELKSCREVRFYLNNSVLSKYRLVNTPGLGDHDIFEDATLSYMSSEESDIIVWTFYADQAGSQNELGWFSQHLLRRKSNVIGIVTHSFDGQDKDSYDPLSDKSMVEVLQHIRDTFGDFISELLLYDSHVTRSVISAARENPIQFDDERANETLKRSGYLQWENYLQSKLHDDYDGIIKERIRSSLKQNVVHIEKLERVCIAIKAKDVATSAQYEQRREAWLEIDRKIVKHTKDRLQEALRNFSNNKAEELVLLMAKGTKRAINDNFNLLNTLGRSIVSWTGKVHSAAIMLDKRIKEEVQIELEKANYFSRMTDAAVRLFKQELQKMEFDLEEFNSHINQISEPNMTMIAEGSRPEQVLHSPLIDITGMITKSVLGAVTHILKTMTEEAAKEAAKEGVKEASKQAGKQATKAAAAKMTQDAGKAAVAGTAAKILGLWTVISLPFDIKKLVQDFKTGKQDLMHLVDTQYMNEKPLQSRRIFDDIWSSLEDELDRIIDDAKSNLRSVEDVVSQRLDDMDRLLEDLKNLSTRVSILLSEGSR